MSSERRVVRPYADVEPFQAILDKWCFRIGPEQLSPGEHRTIPSSSFLHDPGVVVCAVDDDALEDVRKEAAAAADAAGYDQADVELVVIAATPYLRLADVVHRASVADDDAIPREIRLEHDQGPGALRTASGGCDVDVYLCLAKDVPSRPLRPARRGTWLGHIRFGLRTELGDLGFTPLPLTADVRSQHQLGADVIRFVDVTPEALLEDDLSAAVELYIDEQVLAVLNQAPTTAGARFFQRQIFLDVVAALIRAVPQDDLPDPLSLAAIENTVLGRVVDAAAGSGRRGETRDQMTARREQALQWLRHDQAKFMALVENSCAPRDELLNLLGGFDD